MTCKCNNHTMDYTISIVVVVVIRKRSPSDTCRRVKLLVMMDYVGRKSQLNVFLQFRVSLEAQAPESYAP